MSSADVFTQINNAILDLQGSQQQTFELPLKKLARLLSDPTFEEVNIGLTQGADLDHFLSESENSGGSFTGSHKLAWPEDDRLRMGMTLLLIRKLADDPPYALNFGYHYFNTGSRKVISGFHALIAQIIIPFARDYKAYVLASGRVAPRPAMPSNKVFIVHGHDEAALYGLARFLEKLGLVSIILKEEPDRGRTIIEKFEQSAEVGFAVILLTPDDVGAPVKETLKKTF